MIEEKDKDPTIQFLGSSYANLKLGFEALNRLKDGAEETEKEAYENAINRCNRFSIIPTREYFGGHNVNEVYLLRGSEGEPLWIMKPINQQNQNLALAEYGASRLAIESDFPIPLTVMVNIGGWKGSVQLFVDDTKSLKEVQQDREAIVLINDLLKLVVFYLLFQNKDRNEGNILFKKEEGIYQAIGIDHDQAMGRSRFVERFQIEYEGLELLRQPFDESVRNLMTQDKLDKYKEILGKCGNDYIFAAITSWMDNVTPLLEEAIDEKKRVCDIIKEIKNLEV